MTLGGIIDHLDRKGMLIQNKRKEYVEKTLNELNYSLECEVEEIKTAELNKEELDECIKNYLNAGGSD